MRPFRLCRHVRCISVVLPPWPTLPFATSECLKARCAHMFQHLLQHGDIQLHPKPFIVLGIDLWYTKFAQNLRKSSSQLLEVSLIFKLAMHPFSSSVFEMSIHHIFNTPSPSLGPTTTVKRPNRKRVRSRTMTLISATTLLCSHDEFDLVGGIWLSISFDSRQPSSPLNSKGMFYITYIFSRHPLTAGLFVRHRISGYTQVNGTHDIPDVTRLCVGRRLCIFAPTSA